MKNSKRAIKYVLEKDTMGMFVIRRIRYNLETGDYAILSVTKPYREGELDDLASFDMNTTTMNRLKNRDQDMFGHLIKLLGEEL